MREFCSWYLRRRAQRGQPFFTTAWQLWWKTVLQSPHLGESGKCCLYQRAGSLPGPVVSQCSRAEPSQAVFYPRQAGAASPFGDKGFPQQSLP